MTTMTRELRGWLAVAALVLALAAGLTVRAGLPDPDSPTAQTRAAATADASPTEAPIAGFNPPLTETITPPTRPAGADASPAPSASPPPAPATPIAAPPPASPPAPAPAAPPPPPAPTPTPEPVHDDEPSLQTFERVDGAFGQTLTIGAYGVRAVRVAAPVPDACLEGDPSNVEVFDVTLTYSGPLYSVGFAIDSPTFAWCVDATGDASQQFASGVTRQVVVHIADGYTAADAPLLVSLMPVNGPHTLLFGFH